MFRPAEFTVFLLLVSSVAFGQSGQAAPPSIKEPAAPMQPAPPAPPLIIIDPAHGGSDPGAQLTSAIPEKDVTLMFARRLQQQLQSRGISSTLTRNADVTLSTDQRAELANASAAILYLCLHASSTGKGVRVFTGILTSADDKGPFLNWQTAQAANLSRSAWAEQQMVATLQKTGMPARALMAPLQPLNNIEMPGLAIEVAPSGSNSLQLASPDYQDMIGAALAVAVANLAPSLRPRSLQTSTAPNGTPNP